MALLEQMTPDGPFFLIGKSSTLGDRQAEEMKVVLGNEDRTGPLGLVNACQVHWAQKIARHLLENAGLLAPQVEFNFRGNGSGASSVGIHEFDNAIRFGGRYRFQQDGIYHREDGGVHSDAERQCTDHSDVEPWSLAHGAEREVQVLP